jgi:hypothetical protein
MDSDEDSIFLNDDGCPEEGKNLYLFYEDLRKYISCKPVTIEDIYEQLFCNWDDKDQPIQDCFFTYCNKRTTTGFKHAYLLIAFLSTLSYQRVREEGKSFFEQFGTVDKNDRQVLFYELGAIFGLLHSKTVRKTRRNDTEKKSIF